MPLDASRHAARGQGPDAAMLTAQRGTDKVTCPHSGQRASGTLCGE